MKCQEFVSSNLNSVNNLFLFFLQDIANILWEVFGLLTIAEVAGLH